MQTTEDIINAIKADDFQVTSLMITDLIETHMLGEGKHIEDLWKRYKLKDVPIMHHTVANYTKVNEKIPNDFFADIVDTKTGYMGNEVTTTVSRESYKANDILNEPEYIKDRKFLRDWQNRTYSEDKNSEQVRDCGATGQGYRLLYVPEGLNEVKIMNLNPWEVIYIYDASLDEAVAAIRYWTMDKKVTGGDVTKAIVVEWYDEQFITYYIKDESQDFHIDLSRGKAGIQEHLFNGVPIIPFVNNGIKYAEPEKALALIDAYDLILSATTSEIEQLRLAYMYIKGAGGDIDDKFMKMVEQTGAFGLEPEGEVGFINKQLAVEGVKVILDEIRKNIYQFSKSIDLSKEFAGDIRVIGWQVALLNMEGSSIITERKFRMSLRKQYILLTDYWREFQQVDIDPYIIEFTFTRNFPRDIQAEAETLMSLLSSVSTETAYSQMSFIEDPLAEIKKKDLEENPFRDVGEEVARKMINSAGSIKIDGD